jgi:hypothetical protein
MCMKAGFIESKAREKKAQKRKMQLGMKKL